MTALCRALIVPAMSSGPDDHWYPDLRQRLGSAGFIDIRTAHLPDGEPLLEEWLAAIALEIDGVDENTLIVGHSLGAVAALAYRTAHADVQAVGRLLRIRDRRRRQALPGWLHFDDHRRTHAAIGAPPISRRDNLPGHRA